LILTLLLAGLVVAWLAPRPQTLLSRQRAGQAWAVRRGEALSQPVQVLEKGGDPGAALARARMLYLQGQLLQSLQVLSDDPQDPPEGWSDLRQQARDALAVDVAFPSTVLRHVTWDAEAGDLARVVDDGPGEGLSLEVFGRRQERYRRLDMELLRPDGGALREGRLGRLPVGGLTTLDAPRSGAQAFVRLEHNREGKPTLDLGISTPGGVTLYRFQGLSRPTLKDATVTIPGGDGQASRRWRWQDGRFRALD
jgi:hypothetical protein